MSPFSDVYRDGRFSRNDRNSSTVTVAGINEILNERLCIAFTAGPVEDIEKRLCDVLYAAYKDMMSDKREIVDGV